MMDYAGKELTADCGKKYVLEKLLARGGQGMIFTESEGNYLVKILLSRDAGTNNQRYRMLQRLSRLQYSKRFVKPIDLFHGERFCGYAMERLLDMQPLSQKLIFHETDNFPKWYGSLRTRLMLAYMLCAEMHKLHQSNLAYCDLSDRNVLFKESEKNGSEVLELRLIDIDNLYIPGSGRSNVRGTLRYMAPEIANEQMEPDFLSDDYSLAILVFELLRISHPFIGDDVDNGSPEFEEKAYLGELPYIDSPSADWNKKTNWLSSAQVFNKKLEALFAQTFEAGRGLTNRMARASANDFAMACLEALNQVCKCDACGGEYIAEQSLVCPWCGQAPKDATLALLFCRYVKTNNWSDALREQRGRHLYQSFDSDKLYILRRKRCHVYEHYISDEENKIAVYFNMEYDSETGKYAVTNPNNRTIVLYEKGQSFLDTVDSGVNIEMQRNYPLQEGAVLCFGNPWVFLNKDPKKSQDENEVEHLIYAKVVQL